MWVWSHPSITQEVSDTLCQLTEPHPTLSFNALDNELLRFRLIGPQSHPVLMSVLHPMDPVPYPESGNESDNGVLPEGQRHLESLPNWAELVKTSAQRQWWVSDSIARTHAKDLTAVLDSIASCTSPSCFSHGAALSMTVKDPRLFTPKVRTTLACPPATPTSNASKIRQELMTMLEREGVETEDLKESGEVWHSAHPIYDESLYKEYRVFTTLYKEYRVVTTL